MLNIRKNKNVNRALFENKSHDPEVRFQGLSPTGKQPLKASALMKSPGSHHARLGKYAANLWKEKAMTDVVIVVQNQEFKAHKAVLACYSPYFSEVLVKPGFSDIHYLQLPSVTAKAFEILLEYMYTGELKVTCQELSDVYRSARRLGMKGALKKCIEMLHVSSENFQNMVYLYVTARKLDLLDSSVRAFRLMVLHFERLVMTREFLDLEVEQVLELFSADEIGARSEVIVFLAALKWVNHKYIDREEHIIPVFNCVRFPLMSMEEIMACYHPPVLPGIVTKPEIKDAILNATCFIVAKSLGQEKLFSQLAAKPRIFLFAGEPMVLWDISVFDPEKYQVNKRTEAATKIQAAIRGYLARKHFKEDLHIANCASTVIQSTFRGYYVRKALLLRKKIIEGEVPVDKTSTAQKSKKSQMSPFASKALGEIFHSREMPSPPPLLYVMGAFNSEKGPEGQNVIFKFNSKDKNFERIMQCHKPRHDAKMISTADSLYVLGGYNPLDRATTERMQPLKECYKFQFDSDKWSLLPPMNHARSLHGAAAFNGMILAIGGRDERNNILKSIEKYNDSANVWEEFRQPLPEPRMAMGIVSNGSSLWIAGGITSDGENISILDSVWCYDRIYGRWIRKPKLPKALAFPTLLMAKDKLLCIGGAMRTDTDDESKLDSTKHVSFLDGDKWVKQVPMPVNCHSAIAGSSGNNVYIFGGFCSQKMSQLTEIIYFDDNEKRWLPLSKLPDVAAGFMVAASQYQP